MKSNAVSLSFSSMESSQSPATSHTPRKVIQRVSLGGIPAQPKSTEVLSKQQEAILDFVKNGAGSGLVDAKAGTGKTFILLRACQAIPSNKRIAVMAYNKSIATEIEDKVATLGLSNVTVRTCHSFGLATIKAIYRNVRPDAAQKKRRMLENVKAPDSMREAVAKLISIAKQSAVGVLWEESNMHMWQELIERFDILVDIKGANGGFATEAQLIDALVGYAINGLAYSQETAHYQVDFDDMLWIPLVEDMQMVTYDWVIGDEVQDFNAVRRLIAAKMMRPGSRALFAGDRNQCQPAGTLVSVCKTSSKGGRAAEIEQVPIEQLRVGDRVVSYGSGDIGFVMNGRKVLEIAKRPFSGDLVEVYMPEHDAHSRYTPNHKCVVNFNSLRDHWAVYVMRRGNQYRVGKAKMCYSTSSGVAKRMLDEGADCSWIIRTFDSEERAFYFEQMVAGRFGLPQLMFSPTNQTRESAAQLLPRAWKFIGDNSERGEKCLRHFGRMVEYPLFTRGSLKQQTIKRPTVTEACNLLDGVLMLPFRSTAHAKKTDWKPVVLVQQHYEGDVFSLRVEAEEIYVADGIVTHNCIYAFSGADSASVDFLLDDFDAIEMPLTTTYRCSRAATAVAQEFVPTIEAGKDNKDGSVESMPMEKFETMVAEAKVGGGDAILCRLTKPLVKLCLKLIAAGVPAFVEGRDIGRSLDALVRKWDVESTGALVKCLESYRLSETRRLIEQGNEYAIDSVNDKIDAVLAIMSGCDTVADVRAKIIRLFDDTTDAKGKDSRVLLSTVHKSKGREWNRVFILGWDKYMPSKRARFDWQKQAEANLQYVAVTRTRDALVFLSDEG